VKLTARPPSERMSFLNTLGQRYVNKHSLSVSFEGLRIKIYITVTDVEIKEKS